MLFTAGQTFSNRKKVLVEKHLISPIFSEAGLQGSVFTESNKISIMVNEEDHLRIQVLMPGNCWKGINWPER